MTAKDGGGSRWRDWAKRKKDSGTWTTVWWLWGWEGSIRGLNANRKNTIKNKIKRLVPEAWRCFSTSLYLNFLKCKIGTRVRKDDTICSLACCVDPSHTRAHAYMIEHDTHCEVNTQDGFTKEEVGSLPSLGSRLWEEASMRCCAGRCPTRRPHPPRAQPSPLISLPKGHLKNSHSSDFTSSSNDDVNKYYVSHHIPR